MEQIAVADETDVNDCAYQLSLWARYASQQLYFEGHWKQSDCVLNLVDAFSAEDRHLAGKIDPRSDLIYRAEIYRGILEELLDTSEVNMPDPRASRLNELRDAPEVDDEGLSKGPPADDGDFPPARVPSGGARGSTVSWRKSLLLITLLLVVSAALFFTRVDLKRVVPALAGGEVKAGHKASGSRPPSGVWYPDLGNADSIFLTKLDNPPEDRRQQKFIIWLAATGNVTYTIDSVTVIKRGGIFDSEARPGPPEDADYVIDYKGYSEENHLLMPSLVLTPSEHELSFTLVLRHVTEYGIYCDKVAMEMHYLGSDGMEGRLYVSEPPEEALTLSRLLETDIQFRGIVTTPQGVQRGVAKDKAAPPKLIYEAVEDVLTSVYDPALTPERAALDTALTGKNLTPKIIELLGADNKVAFDLCSTLPDPRCDAALVSSGAPGGDTKKALHYLSLRHSLRPGAALADFILSVDFDEYLSGPGEESDLGEPACALANHPSGRWVRALLALALVNRDSLSLLDSKTESMTKAERRMVENFHLRESGGGAERGDGVPRSWGRLPGDRVGGTD